MAEILDRDHVSAVPQDDGRCIYASDGQALLSVSMRTREQFDAERDRFENGGVKLPELVPVEGFEEEANVDPRYNSLNVTAGERIISVEIVGTEPSDPEEQLELEKDVARPRWSASRRSGISAPSSRATTARRSLRGEAAAVAECRQRARTEA